MAGYEQGDYARGDGLWTNIIRGGETVPEYSLVYLDANSKWILADADDATTESVVGLATEPLRLNQKGRVLTQGIANYNAWAWTPGAVLYASSVPGGLTETPPASQVKAVATAITATMILFDPATAGAALDPHTEALYIIWTDGTTYYAKNGATGAIDFSGTVFSTVMQSAINAGPGGEITIKPGVYSVTVPIETVKELTIQGSYGYGSSNGVTLNVSPGITCFRYTGGVAAPFVKITDLFITGGLNAINFNDKVYDVVLRDIYVANTSGDGIIVTNGWGLIATHVIVERCAQNGFTVLFSGSSDINSCKFNDNGAYGLYYYASDGRIIGNEISGNVGYGARLRGAHRTSFIGNRIGGNTGTSGVLATGNNLIITGNEFNGINVELYNLYIDSGVTSALITNNQFQGATTACIRNISTGATIKNNKYSTVTPLSDTGTGTILASKTFQFTEPIIGAIVVVSPTGVDVDAATEGALVWGQLPIDVQQVMRIRVWAVATGGPIGAGGQMHLAITFNAGAANATYNTATKSWTLADFDGTDTDYVTNDVVSWVIVDANVGNELKNLVAGDSFEFFALYNAGADPDGATDAVFRCIEIEYV